LPDIDLTDQASHEAMATGTDRVREGDKRMIGVEQEGL
jgi:hypothetical protein